VFKNWHISQGSLAKRLGCGAVFNSRCTSLQIYCRVCRGQFWKLPVFDAAMRNFVISFSDHPILTGGFGLPNCGEANSPLPSPSVSLTFPSPSPLEVGPLNNARLTLLYTRVSTAQLQSRLIISGSPRDIPNNVELIHSSHFLPTLMPTNTPSFTEQLSTGMLFLTQSFWHHQRNPSEQHSTDHLPPHPVPAVNSVTPRLDIYWRTGSGERCKQTPPAGSGAELRKSNLVHFSLKIWHLVAQFSWESIVTRASCVVQRQNTW